MQRVLNRAIASLLLGVLACMSTAAHAQVSAQVSATSATVTSVSAPSVPAPSISSPIAAAPLSSAPVAGERLSDWLLRQPSDELAYRTGLVWQVPAERYAQAGRKRDLLVLLAVSEKAPAAARESLTRMIQALPVTGRVAVPFPDPRWLQAHPKEDPVLQRDHALTLPQRPGTVSVLTEEGKRCSLPHRLGAIARDYLQACQPGSLDRVDRAWVVQPDGTVRSFGIARWNEEGQDEEAPGALIWAPARDSGWSPRFSTQLAEFLSTQGYEAVLSASAQTSVAPAAEVAPGVPARDAAITANDWGVVGLLQTPTARMAQAGEARFNYSRVYPYEHYNVFLQPLDWLEAGFRYTNIMNRLYGPEELSGRQTYKDKSVDFKVRLLKESANLPQIAFGITDIGGTGFFSSEYLVANKRRGDFDWSLGMAWGNMGASGNIRNPFTLLGKSFESRTVTGSSGGTVDTAGFFHGNAALFGGVQYQLPSDKWLFKAEYDGNNYQHEPLDNNRNQRAPINLGLVYRYAPGVDFTAGLERGNTVMFSMTLHSALDKLAAPKLSDAPMPRVVASRPTAEPIWAGTAGDISAVTRWGVRQISRDGRKLRVVVENAGGAYWNDRIERLTAVLHRDAPASIDEFDLVIAEQGIPMSERIILREPWVKQQLQYQVISDRFQAIAAAEPRGDSAATSIWERDQSRQYGYSIIPTWQQNIGGPDGFLLFSAGVAAAGGWKLAEGTSITGQIGLHLLDNYANFKYDAPSNLPRVRTNLRQYMTESPITMPNLQITHIGQLSRNQYYSVYGGYLESMFAGVGAEWLYRPWHSPFAFGIDINGVQARGFKQDFSLRDYRAATGHATAYWDTGWKSTQVKLNVGQYLAGDIGATLDVSRTFNNGVAIGAWATKTNVSAEQFGEGSFDKGIYLKIPFDVMTTSRDSNVANLVYAPLVRDGGARLNRSVTLYGTTTARSKRATSFVPAGSSASSGYDDEDEEWGAPSSLVEDFFGTGRKLGGQVARGQAGYGLWLGGGMVLASSLLDRPIADWAKNHQSPRWDKLGKIANNVPLMLAAGTGMLWWGMGGDLASDTAWTAIKSSALTLGAQTLIKIGVNRARPNAEFGPTHFDPLGKGGANSSFPSTHMGVAFALVTPFAQQYEAPWLYAVAGATAFGRIQQREHFVSDVVAGSAIGYAVGTLLLDQQNRSRRGPKIAFGPNRSITSTWEFD